MNALTVSRQNSKSWAIMTAAGRVVAIAYSAADAEAIKEALGRKSRKAGANPAAPPTAPEAAPAGEVVGLLHQIRDLLASLPADCLGSSEDASGQPYPIRDEVIHGITKALGQPAPTAQGVDKAWFAICDELDRIDPDWMMRGPVGAEAAVAMIRKLAATAQPVAVDGAMVERVAQHIGTVADYIDKAYTNTRMLDRGPIMRNMRRWHEQLTAALRSGSQGEGQA